jgi:chromosome segregation protein
VRLKALRLFGFKTFADQTVLEFEPGITALVGPNGSGKSNLVDAIRWVLGEQSAKSLRAGKTEDVIFAGNERRKPLGMAEVALTFDNDDRRLALDATEVQITRRAYRAGESEFFINRQQARLRDVVDLLMGTGLGPGSYAIVSQGQIDAILSAKPSDRRSLFEETAGINRFLARKAESLRRLEQTEQNAIRLGDLLSEIAARFPELETQARRARRYQRASARARDLEILSFLRASASRRLERESLQRELERFEAERAAAAARAAEREAELSALRAELYRSESALDRLRERATEARAAVAELETQHAAHAARREVLESQSSQVTDDRERGEAERAALHATVAALEAELGPQNVVLEAQRVRARQAQEALATARAALDRIFSALREVEAAAAADAASDAERRAQLQAAQLAYERLEREAFELREAARAQSEAAAAQAHSLERAQARLADSEMRLAAAQAITNAAEHRVAAAGDALARAEAAYRAATSELAGAEARLHTIEELEANLEGHVPGTRAVLAASARGELSGIHGVVSNLIGVEETYARALDVAFGAGLSNIVTETSADAERAITYLRTNELGRATFLPLDALGRHPRRDVGELPQMAGVIAYAQALVESEPRYAGVIAFLIGRVLIVEDLSVGVQLVRRHGFAEAIVGLDGDEIRDGGAMSGGRYPRERSILSRRAQARTLSERIPMLREGLAEAEALAQRAREESEAATRERADAARSEAELAIARRAAQAEAEKHAAERVRCENEAAMLLARAQERDGETAATRGRLALLARPAIDQSAARTERERLEAALTEARDTIARAHDAERAVVAEIAGSRERVAAISAKHDGLIGRIALLDADRERAARARDNMLHEIALLAARVSESEKALQDARSGVAQIEAQADAAKAVREAALGRAAGLESDVRLAANAERDAANAGEGGRLRLAEIDAELGMLAAHFAQHPATAQECADVEARYARDQTDPAPELARLREELGRLQNVNLNAAAEIEELAERERFLKTQLDDLARARTTLLDSIREIEATAQTQFHETFRQVQAAFAEVYARLFPGGTAAMWLTDPEQTSQAGVEISAQPPGKKMMPLNTLSGGERSMTASALIFALIKVKPSPFYLLDEIDAALDDANIVRFSNMVREVAANAQLLVVTHNKMTMELAERMYGVTMAEPGISAVIATDLSVPRAVAGTGAALAG